VSDIATLDISPAIITSILLPILLNAHVDDVDRLKGSDICVSA